MAGLEEKFKQVLDKRQHANYDLNPEGHERVYLYSFLYNEIINNMPDYGITSNFDVGPRIDEQIYKYIGWIKQIVNGASIDSLGLEPNEKDNVKKWMGDGSKLKGLLPLWKAGEDDALKGQKNLTDDEAKAKNIVYLDNFIKNFETSRQWARTLKADLGGEKNNGVLTTQEALGFMNAEIDKIQERWIQAKALVEGKPGSFKKNKDGNGVENDQGMLFTEFENAKRDLKKRNRAIWASIGRTVLKGAAALAFVGLTGFCGFGLLSVGGGAIAKAMGGLVANSIGRFLLYGVGMLAGGTFTKKAAESFVQEYFAGRVLRKDRRDFLNENGKYSFDGKNKSFKSIREKYYQAMALRDAMQLGVDNWNKLPRKLKKYLPKDVFKKYFTEDTNNFKFVNTKGSGMRRLQALYSHQVTMVEGKGELGSSDLFVMAQNVISGANPKMKDLIDIARRIKDNESSSGSKLSVENRNMLNAGISRKIVDAINDEIFENSYSGSTRISDMLKPSFVSERLDDPTLMEGKKRKIYDSLALLSSIEKDCERLGDKNLTLNRDINVNLESQLSFDAEKMLNACGTLSDSGAPSERDSAIEIIEKLCGANSKTEVEAIDLTPIASKSQAFGYLKFMKDKKMAQSKRDELDIANRIVAGGGVSPEIADIAAKIARLETKDLAAPINSGDVSKLQEIRQNILGTTFDSTAGKNEEIRGRALKILDEQIKSLEIKRRDDSRAAVLKSVKEGELNVNNGKEEKTSLSDILKQISEKKYEDIRDNYLYGSVILKATPDSIKNYLIDVYKLQIEKICTKELNDNKSKYTSAEGAIDAAITYLVNVSDCAALDQSQKDRLYEKMAQYLKISLEEAINEDKKNFAVLANNNSLKLSKYTTWLENAYGGHGLKEFFESKNPLAEQLKKKVEYMSRLGSLTELLKSTAGEQTLKETENESLAFSTIYLINKDSRDDSDPLFRSLKTMKEKSDKSKAFNFATTTTDFNDIQFVKDMLNELQTIINFRDAENPDGALNDKYAALIILKKRCLAAYKMHAKQYLDAQSSFSSPETYFREAANRGKFKAEVLDKWCGDADSCLLTRIDKALEECSSLPIYKKYPPTSAVDIAAKAMGQTTVTNFYQGSELS